MKRKVVIVPAWFDSLGQYHAGRTIFGKLRKPIPKMSARRKVQSRIYSKKRRAFLRSHPYCELHVNCGGNPAVDVHHVKGRLQGNYLDETTWLAACRSCHDWVHSHPSKAREIGMLK